MAQAAFDADALIDLFAHAHARQSEQLREAVRSSTLAALQGREMSLKNIRAALKAVVQAAGEGVAQNALPGVDAQGLLDNAVAGMDEAMLRAVEANRLALQQFVDRGADLQDKNLKKAVEDLDRFEDMLIDVVKKAAAGVDGANLAGPWSGVLEKMQAGGTRTGAQASSTIEQMTEQMQQVQQSLRASRAAGLKAAQAMAQSYSMLVSGVLIGMSEALQQGQRAAGAAGAGAGEPGASGAGTASPRRSRKG